MQNGAVEREITSDTRSIQNYRADYFGRIAQLQVGSDFQTRAIESVEMAAAQQERLDMRAAQIQFTFETASNEGHGNVDSHPGQVERSFDDQICERHDVRAIRCASSDQ